MAALSASGIRPHASIGLSGRASSRCCRLENGRSVVTVHSGSVDALVKPLDVRYGSIPTAR